ncbi:hypothetical protein RD792_001534 [Penstemon davidsonii]|uniref:Cellulose synthase-like protein G3 n=1 Tax=Penstemon davidsonii TaxID=160366 RepID=A0ABR0DNP7_9LAMI|nr:hypothetical protein RD792_001534 [Penstemon davidsonii]
MESRPPLHDVWPLRRRHFNRLFAVVYSLAILTLFYHHVLKLLQSNSTLSSFFINIPLFVADIILSYMWSTLQAYRMNPLNRKVFPENLEKYLAREDFPAIDIFICTADPFKEPPINVVNTALSVMAYDYPSQKLSVYVSDDGGSELTMFAFMEAAKFGKIWLPFCRENNIMDRCPDAYFKTNCVLGGDALEIKMMYESMKMKVEKSVEVGKVSDDYISTSSGENRRHVLSKYWGKDFTRQNHPPIIQVLSSCNKDVDISNEAMPNLVYVSREKSKATPHNFKAGALNTLLRVSASMTNAPIILTLDCDMYSNDPFTPQRALCYISDKSTRPNLGYVQFPQLYHGLNKADIYGCDYKRSFQVNPVGMDGLAGPCYFGTCCFFNRRVFFGGPSSYVQPEIPELSPDLIVDKPVNDREILSLAHHVAGCSYEYKTNWGSRMGFRYGSLVEDYYTGYRLQCEGWQSIFCDPTRPAFLGDVPISLIDALSQNRRWCVGFLEVTFSKYSPVTFGIRSMGILMGQSYAHYAFWPIWSIPITIYAFLPSLALLNGIPILPKVHEPWFFLYVFMFLGAYAQDCLDFILTKGTFRRWWSDQRMWLVRGVSSQLFAVVEYISRYIGVDTHGYNLTSKVTDNEQSKRYEEGKFEFGVPSPMFVSLATATILNLIAFLIGTVHMFRERSLNNLFFQVLIAGFGVLNSLPFYEAMVMRSDSGKMPTKITIISTLSVVGIYGVTSFVLRT